MYIVRSQGSDEVDGALGMLKLDKCRKTNDEVSSVLGKFVIVFLAF